MNKLTVNAGPMFSGKTTALQQQGKKHIKAGQNVIFLKPAMDTRYSESEIITHDGDKVEAFNIDKTILIDEVCQADVILIDEVQFLAMTILSEIKTLLNLGKTVYCSGLDMDYLGIGFNVTMHLLAMAEKVNKFAAICKCCGEDATMTSKILENGRQIELGTDDIYYPTCRLCHSRGIIN